MDTNTNTNRFLPGKISWLTIILALLSVVTFFAISSPGRDYVVSMGGSRGVMESGGGMAVPPSAVGTPAKDMGGANAVAPDMIGSNMYYPYPYPNPDVPITDTREFLKVYYSATMRTRDVPSLTRRVETTVRGYDGRIDQESSSEKYGYISFALPQTKYDAFRTELESIVNKRFLTVNISSQNLLSQKVSIEDQQKEADKAVAEYNTSRQKIIIAHGIAVQGLQAKIEADENQLTTLRAESSTPIVQAEIQRVSDDLSHLKKQLASENSSYTNQLSNIDSYIKYAKDRQAALIKQDQTFTDNVATVTGTVSISWISLWDILLLYLPGYWIPTIFAVLAILSFMRDRRRAGFQFPNFLSGFSFIRVGEQALSIKNR